MFSVFKDWTLSTLSLPILMHHQPPRAQLAPSPSLTSLQSAELPTISLQSAEQIQINTVRIIVRFLFFFNQLLNKITLLTSVHQHGDGHQFGDPEHAFDWNHYFTLVADSHFSNSVWNDLHGSIQLSSVVHFRYGNSDFLQLPVC